MENLVIYIVVCGSLLINVIRNINSHFSFAQVSITHTVLFITKTNLEIKMIRYEWTI